jgi:1-deoxy-D-xylulose-5-phosphate reductoisomerase
MSQLPAHNIAVFGATGSIGASALDVIARHPDSLRATVLAAGSKVDALLALCRVHRPRHAVIADVSQFAALRDGLFGRHVRELCAGATTEGAAGGRQHDALEAGMRVHIG